MRGKHPFMGIIISFFIIALSISPQMRSLYAMPERVTLYEDGGTIAELPYPLSARLSQDCRSAMKMSDSAVSDPSPHLVVRLFDFIPIKHVAVDHMPSVKVMAGGHSIGVTMQMDGVLVVGYSAVTAVSGVEEEPARDAGIKIGDRIVTINGVPITDDQQVATLIHQGGMDGKEIVLGVMRGEAMENIICRTVFCAETQAHRIGLFVRDTAVGIGTLTFYEPTDRSYGALGHVITDSDTNREVVCASGSIMPASVSLVHQGIIGYPGEKIGVTWEGEASLGTIEKNTSFGIYGKLTADLSNPYYPEAIPVASRSQVSAGRAEVLTVVDGEKIESFAIEIEKLYHQNSAEEKGMLIHIVDEDLIMRTGGIVQGMSGSPIIQNGRLVGAVTHVLVNDPSRGYGIFIENMLNMIE